MQVKIKTNNMTKEQASEALAIAKQGLAIGVSALIVTLIKWCVIGFGLFLLGKYLRLI